jgi:predicted nucleic acid-binding protein
MTLRVVDTNIVSFDMRGHSLGARYKPHLDGYTLAIAFMTVAEIYEGAWLAAWGSRRLRHMETVLGRYTVLYADDDLCRLWGTVREQRRRQPIGVADAWIAAVALQYGGDLVTHNPRDFQGVAGLTIITEAP